ncbi:hypothetical protein VCSRO206_3458 [Vibrio cholerae]|nr:hypothetical protein VCSRO206_3458 [Vibrio cholerae]
MTDKFTISLPVFDTCLSSNGLREVTKSSSFDEKEALEIMARYFKNEMHFDNVQYDAKKHDENTIGFMFIENAIDICTDEHDQMPTRCVGGCLFRNVGGTWVLCWVWLHPFLRNQKKLSYQWKRFCDEFGDFAIEAPVSPSMETFLAKQKTEHRLVKIR